MNLALKNLITLLACFWAASALAQSPVNVPAQPAQAPSNQALKPAQAGFEILGVIKPTSGGKALRPVEIADAVIYFRPRLPQPVTVPEQAAVMNTLRKQFVPRALPIVVGQQVSFPNNDPILHNAFSTATGNEFDAGLYGQGESETVSFKRPGLVRVYCNVHHSMMAHVLVLDTPHFTKPDALGRFALRGLAGDGELFIWHERATLWRRAIVAGETVKLAVDLNLSKRRVPAHLNKFGKPYRRAGSDY